MIAKNQQKKKSKAQPRATAKNNGNKRRGTRQRPRPRAQPPRGQGNRIGVFRTIATPLPLGTDSFKNLGEVRTEGGSKAYRVQVTDLVATLTSDSSKKLLPANNYVTLGPSIFNAMAAYKLLYDRVRLVGLTFWWVPSAATTTPGTICMFIDYKSDSTVDSLAKAVRTQEHAEFSPWETGNCLVWKSQGPVDYEYIASTSTGAFNPANPARLGVYGENLNTETLTGYIHASAVLELTGRQSV